MGVQSSHRLLAVIGLGVTILATAPPPAQPDQSTVEGRFAHVTSKLDQGGVYYHYIDLEGLADEYFEATEAVFRVIRDNVPDPDGLGALETLAEKGGPIYRYLGISAIRGFGSSSVPDGDGFVTRSFLSLDRAKMGDRPTPMVAEPRARKGLHLAPEQTQVFLSCDVSVADAIRMIYDIADITHPGEGRQQLDDGFEMAQAFTTMPWKQALTSLDGEMVVALWADRDDWRTMQGAQGTFEIPNIHYLAALETADSSLLDGLLNWAQLQAFEVENTEAGDVTISTLVPPNFLQNAPRVTLARDETFTYFASEPADLANALTRLRAESGGLANSSEFRSAREGSPEQSNSVLFIDKNINDVIEEATLRNALDDEVGNRLMESFKSIGESLHSPMSTLVVSVQEPDGVAWFTRGPNSARSSGAMLTTAAVGIATAIAVPGFLRAREISRRNACQENQAKLDGALQQFMLENRIDTVGEAIEQIGGPSQQYPVDGTWVGTLIGEDHFIRFEPVCPSGGVYTFNDTDAHPQLPPVSCSLAHRDDVSDRFHHQFPGY